MLHIKRSVIVVSLCVVSLILNTAAAKTLFFDDFESGLDKWPELPTLSVDKEPDNPGNHVLVFDTTNDNANVDALFLEGFEDLTDYTIRAKVNIVGGGDITAIALIVRAQGVENYVCAELATKRAEVEGILNLFERGPKWPIVAFGKVDVDVDTWYELALAAKGNTITGYLDGKKVLEYSDAKYPKGGFGIREWTSKSLIDNVEVFDTGGSDIQPVKPRGKLSVVWGTLKTGSF